MSNHAATSGLGSAKATSAWILGALLAVATASEAQNLIVLNPEFDEAQMTSGWGVAESGADVSWVSDEDLNGCHMGSGRSGALRTESRGSLGFELSTLRVDQCFAVGPGQVIWTEIAHQLEEDALIEIRSVVRFYEQGGCDGPDEVVFGESHAYFSPNFWKSSRWSFLVPESKQSMRVEWESHPETFFFGRYKTVYDRAYVGTQERILADDFEAGASCRWSSVVGEVIVEDVTPPTDPGPIDSASHDLGAAPPPILLSWAPSTDSESGLRTYRAGFAAGLFEVLCGDLQEVGIVTGGQSQDDLPLDTYYFYLCAEDHAGNQSNVVVGGPYVVQ